jgi:hypothetical protein
VTQGGLVSSEGKVWSRYCDTRRRKGGKRGTQTSAWSHREVGADISVSEVPAEAVPGIGAGNSTQERGQNKRPWIDALEQRLRWVQKAHQEGKAPHFAERGNGWETESRC